MSKALNKRDEVIVTDATHPTPHPSFASQNPPSPQGEGFGLLLCRHFL